MNPALVVDPTTLPYIHIAAGILTVLVGVFLILRASSARQRTNVAEASQLPFDGGNTLVHLGGPFSLIIGHLKNIEDLSRSSKDRDLERSLRLEARDAREADAAGAMVRELAEIRVLLQESRQTRTRR